MDTQTTDAQIVLLRDFQHWLDLRTYWVKRKHKSFERYCESKLEEIQRRMRALEGSN